MNKSYLFFTTLLLFSLVLGCFRSPLPQTPVDQTCYVLSLDGKPLEGREVKLSGAGILHITAAKKTAFTDVTGKVNFKFDWQEVHESGSNSWYLDATTGSNLMAVNRLRDPNQLFGSTGKKTTSIDTIRMDSIEPFKIKLKSVVRIRLFDLQLISYESYNPDFEFLKLRDVPVANAFLDTIINVNVYKNTIFRVSVNYSYSDKVGGKGSSYYIKPIVPRDKVYEVIFD